MKIKTNNKFKIIPIVITKKHDIINGNKINYSDQGKVPGLTITRTGIGKHVNDNKNKGIKALSELQRFYNVPTNIKLHLIKAFVLPILSYPFIPLITASNTSKKKLQTVQNQTLRFAFNEKHRYNRHKNTA